MSPTWTDVIARRVERNHLASPGSDPADVVAAMCGAHAQILSAAEISVAMRLPDATRGDVQKALWTDRTLVKTFGPRGTVHLLPTSELGLWAGAMAALPHSSPFAAGVRMTAEQNEQVVAALDETLGAAEDGLTVNELSAEVVARAGPWAGDLVMPAFQTMWPRWRTIVGSPLTQGVLCFGPSRGRNVTYTSPALWAPGFSLWEPKEALREVIRRYLWTYGPSTSAHVARWLAAPPRFVADVFATLELQPVTIDGEETMLLAGDDVFPGPASSSVRLLPYFDAYGVGAHPRAVTFPGRAFSRALARGQAGNYPVLLIDGRAAGVWHHRLSGRRVQVTVEPLSPLPAARLRALETEVERLGQILAATPTLTVGAVQVGPHA